MLKSNLPNHIGSNLKKAGLFCRDRFDLSIIKSLLEKKNVDEKPNKSIPHI